MCDNSDSYKTIELNLMKQASSTLKRLRFKPKLTEDELFAERTLLRSGERIKLLSQKVFTADSKMDSCCSKGTADGSFSNFNFTLKPRNDYKKYRAFYVCTVTRGVDVRISNAVEAREHTIHFEDIFKFEKLQADFVIDVKVFSLGYKRRPTKKLRRGLFGKFCSNQHNLESNFKLCGRFRINGIQTITNALDIIHIEDDSPLAGRSSFTMEFSDVSIDHRQSGIVNVGKVYKSALILWNIQWCVLDGMFIKIYSSPIDEDFNRPDFVIDLKLLSGFGVAHDDECTKRRTLKLRVMNSEKGQSTDVYFITTVNSEEYKRWKEALNCVVTSLLHWRALSFYEQPAVKRETLIN